MFDTQRNAFALSIDRQHNSLDLITLFEITQCVFAILSPGNVGQMHQTVNATVGEAGRKFVPLGRGAPHYLSAVMAAPELRVK